MSPLQVCSFLILSSLVIANENLMFIYANSNSVSWIFLSLPLNLVYTKWLALLQSCTHSLLFLPKKSVTNHSRHSPPPTPPRLHYFLQYPTSSINCFVIKTQHILNFPPLPTLLLATLPSHRAPSLQLLTCTYLFVCLFSYISLYIYNTFFYNLMYSVLSLMN